MNTPLRVGVKMYEELIGKRVKVVLKVENSTDRVIIFEGLFLSEGEDYIKIRDKYDLLQFIKKNQLATVGEARK